MVRGQAAQRLSEHYQLECDFGMSILTIYNEGDAVYLCEDHVSAITPKDNCFAGIRPVELSDKAGIEEAVDANNGRDNAAEIAADGKDVAASVSAGALTTEAAPLADENGANAPTGVVEAAQAASFTPTSTDGPGDPQGELPSASSGGDSGPAENEHSATILETAPVAAPAAVEKPAADRAAAKKRRNATAAGARAAARDLAYGNPAKALVDETIWNMAPGDLAAYRSALAQGKTPLEAAQAAGGQLAVVHRKIAEYTAKIEPILSASQATISVGYAIDKPLEQAILEIIGTDAMAETEKDAAVEHLGAFQKQMKSGLEAVISPLQAYRIAREIGERANWGGHSGEIEQVRQAYRAAYARLRDALRAFVPEARELEERLANLLAAQSEIEGAGAPQGRDSAPA